VHVCTYGPLEHGGENIFLKPKTKNAGLITRQIASRNRLERAKLGMSAAAKKYVASESRSLLDRVRQSFLSVVKSTSATVKRTSTKMHSFMVSESSRRSIRSSIASILNLEKNGTIDDCDCQSEFN
jgi:hypothetical protein